MTRIPSGVTDQGFYFFAADQIDFVTPRTGLSAFSVYRSRNNGSAVAMTTPTITEVDSTNMPGVYFLLCDEDMIITSGNIEEEMLYRISCSGMAPVVKAVTLFDALGDSVEGSYDLRETLRLMAAALLGEVSGAGTTTVTIRDMSDTKTRVTATVDTDGNRTAVTLDPS